MLHVVKELLYFYFFLVYIFLGDEHALIDFVRELQRQGLNTGEYVVVAVQESPYNPKKKFEYTKICKLFSFLFTSNKRLFAMRKDAYSIGRVKTMAIFQPSLQYRELSMYFHFQTQKRLL